MFFFLTVASFFKTFCSLCNTFSLFAENVPAALVGKDLCALYCTGFHPCPYTAEKENAAAEMCWSLGINDPSKKLRLN